MTEDAPLEKLSVHESVENVIPPEAFVEAFDSLAVDVELIGDNGSYDDTDAIATYVPQPAFLDAGWVHCIRAGYDEFDTAAYETAGVPLTNSTGIHDTTVSEIAIGYMLSLARLHHLYRDNQKQRHWHTPAYQRPFTVENERICVIGLGTIGRGIAERAAALGMDVVGVRQSDESVPGVSELFSPSMLHDAIDGARFVALAVPHTPETDGLIGDAEFDVMRDDGYLINVARGPLVDESALISALEDDTIAGAGLDVFETEPLPEDSRLWDFDDVIISPHKGSATNRYHLDIAELVIENFERYQTADTLRNRVA